MIVIHLKHGDEHYTLCGYVSFAKLWFPIYNHALINNYRPYLCNICALKRFHLLATKRR